jgi:hypothetical protein
VLLEFRSAERKKAVIKKEFYLIDVIFLQVITAVHRNSSRAPVVVVFQDDGIVTARTTAETEAMRWSVLQRTAA